MATRKEGKHTKHQENYNMTWNMVSSNLFIHETNPFTIVTSQDVQCQAASTSIASSRCDFNHQSCLTLGGETDSHGKFIILLF